MSTAIPEYYPSFSYSPNNYQGKELYDSAKDCIKSLKVTRFDWFTLAGTACPDFGVM